MQTEHKLKTSELSICSSRHISYTAQKGVQIAFIENKQAFRPKALLSSYQYQETVVRTNLQFGILGFKGKREVD